VICAFPLFFARERSHKGLPHNGGANPSSGCASKGAPGITGNRGRSVAPSGPCGNIRNRLDYILTCLVTFLFYFALIVIIPVSAISLFLGEIYVEVLIVFGFLYLVFELYSEVGG